MQRGEAACNHQRRRRRTAMASGNGAGDGDIRRAPDTFKLADWPRNCWYVAAYDVEVKRELLARKIAGHNLVLYRREDGTPAALENACWHRLMPLSKGNIEGDNVMDLTHETFVHGASIGQRSIAEVPFDVTHGPDTATVTRWMRDVDPPPFWRMQLEWKRGEPAGRVDRWQIVHFTAPSTVAIDVGVAPAGSGAPEGDRSQGVNGFVLNTMTPETERTCHYFWAFVRNYRLDDQRITTIIREGVSGVFAEDEDVLAAQQRAIEDHPDKQFYNLNIDGGAMWARRLIDKMMAEEGDDERYRVSAGDATAEYGTTTRVEATEADAERP